MDLITIGKSFPLGAEPHKLLPDKGFLVIKERANHVADGSPYSPEEPKMSHITSLTSFILVALASSLTASVPPNPATGLPEAIRAQRNSFRPVADADLNTRRAQLSAAIDNMQRYLATGGANGRRWARFLRVPDLNAELAKGRNADLSVLEEIQPLYTSGYLGLELPFFSEVGKGSAATAMP